MRVDLRLRDVSRRAAGALLVPNVGCSQRCHSKLSVMSGLVGSRVAHAVAATVGVTSGLSVVIRECRRPLGTTSARCSSCSCGGCSGVGPSYTAQASVGGAREKFTRDGRCLLTGSAADAVQFVVHLSQGVSIIQCS